MAKKSRARRFPKRNVPKRSPYDRVLIVCEGSKTEPHYFQSLIDYLKLNTANVEVDGSSNSAPRSVVQHAKRRYQDDSDFDRIYCVFDKDEHPSYAEAVNSLQNARPKNLFHAITSVPCFEFWLLLHFTFTTKPYARSGKRSPADVAISELKAYIPDYEKDDRHIFSQVVEHTNAAIRHAKRVIQQAVQNETDNPTTRVHRLVEYLHHIKEQ